MTPQPLTLRSAFFFSAAMCRLFRLLAVEAESLLFFDALLRRSSAAASNLRSDVDGVCGASGLGALATTSHNASHTASDSGESHRDDSGAFATTRHTPPFGPGRDGVARRTRN